MQNISFAYCISLFFLSFLFLLPKERQDCLNTVFGFDTLLVLYHHLFKIFADEKNQPNKQTMRLQYGIKSDDCFCAALIFEWFARSSKALRTHDVTRDERS